MSEHDLIEIIDTLIELKREDKNIANEFFYETLNFSKAALNVLPSSSYDEDLETILSSHHVRIVYICLLAVILFQKYAKIGSFIG